MQVSSTHAIDMKTRVDSDESYIVHLCDRVLNQKAKRQHTFNFLRGDPGKRFSTGKPLPVDAYYENIKLVVEYRETQHSEVVEIFDNKWTCSGCLRGEQRRRYDQRRREVLRQQGVRLVELDYRWFQHDRKKRLTRDEARDESVIRQKLSSFTTPSESADFAVSAHRA